MVTLSAVITHDSDVPENFLAGSLYVTEQAHCSCGSAPECCCDGDLLWPAHTGASASYLPGILS
jgi:hypothetical protein